MTSVPRLAPPRYDVLRRLLPELTEHQEKIAMRVALGMGHKRIAAELGISPRTVHVHVGRLGRKLMPEEVDLTPRERVILFVRYRQWERVRGSGAV